MSDLPDDVPAAARPLLTRLKRDLRTLVQYDLNRQPNASPAQIRRHILAQLKSVHAGLNGPCVVEGPLGPMFGKQPGVPSPCGSAPAERYGQISQFSIDVPPGHANLRVALVSLNILCGVDDSLYVWRRASGGWKLALLNEVDGYRQIGATQEGLRYAFSPMDRHGRWFMVISHNPPWCTSNWRMVSYQALRLGASPEHPDVLLSRDKEIWLGGNGYLRLRVRPDGFGISFWAAQSLDPGVLIRPHEENYRFVNGRLTRVPPLATDAFGFLDSWMSMPWPDAARYYTGSPGASISPPGSRAEHESVRAFHRRFRKTQSDMSGMVSTSFGAPHRCDDGQEQIELDISNSNGGPTERFPLEVFFRISTTRCDFHVTHVRTRPFSGCTSPAQSPGLAVDTPLPEPGSCEEAGNAPR